MVSLALNAARAQVTDDFETTGCPTTPCQGVISGGCLTNWKTSHGSPFITLVPADAYSNLHALRMVYETNPGGSWGGGGAFRSYSFKKDKCYKIKFWRKYKIGQVAGKFYVYLDNGLTEDVTFTNCYDPVPTGSGPFEIVYSEYLPASQTPTWQEITIQFVPSNDYDQLWLYVEPETTPPSQSGGEFTVDLLRIGESDNAPVADFTYFTYPTNDICEGVVVFENLSEGCEGYTSTWDFGDGSPTSSEQNPSHTYSSSGAYTVTLTIDCPDGGCSDTETHTVTVTGVTYDYTVNGPITLSAAIVATMLPSGGVSNASVKINGILTVDIAYVFNNVDIIMASDGAIDKVNAHTLSINNGSHLTSCDRMWRGIRLIEGTLDMDNSAISNAAFAINFFQSSSAHLNVTDNVFDRNLFGIYTKGDPSTFTIGLFHGNEFNCTAPLLTPAPSVPVPLYGPRSYAGVYILNQQNQAVLPIGVVSSTPNEFLNLCNGIITDGALTLTVLNTRFENILQTNDYLEPTGYGIWCIGTAISNSSLWQDGIPFDNPSGTPCFLNCTQAIRSQSVEILAWRNVMREVVNGIRVETARNRQIILELNDIECERKGIELLNNDPARYLWVSQNTIVVGAGLFGLVSGDGIAVQETGIVQPDAQILNSVVELHQWNSGIQMAATNSYFLHNNSVDMSPSFFPISGLRVAGGANNELACNAVLGNGIGSGLFMTDATSTIWTCNTVEKTYEGAFFRDACTGSRLTTTRFIPPFGNSGLLYISPVMLGAQTHRGNLWNAGTYTNGAVQWVGCNSGDAIANQYRVHTIIQPFYPPSFNLPAGVTPLDWFPAPVLGFPHVCSEDPDCDEVGFTGDDEEEGREMRSRIASGEYDNLPSYGTVAWRAKQQVFAKLEANPELQNESPEVAEFYQNNQQSLLGGLHQIEKGIAQLYQLMPELRESIRAHQEAIREKAAAISEIDAAILAGSGNGNELSEQRVALLEEMQALAQEIASWSTEVIEAQRAQADELLAANTALEALTDYQAYEKTVNAIHLATLAKDTMTFTAEQAETLRFIAEQCPRYGGIGVYKARSLYALIAHVDYNDNEICASDALPHAGLPQQTMPEENFKKSFSVFPNPNSGAFSFEYQTEYEANLVIYDMAGRSVYEQVLNPGSDRIEFSSTVLQPGIYTLSVISEGLVIHSEKLIIIR